MSPIGEDAMQRDITQRRVLGQYEMDGQPPPVVSRGKIHRRLALRDIDFPARQESTRISRRALLASSQRSSQRAPANPT